MSEKNFLEKLIKDVPDAFNYVDGWASHSYPNPRLIISKQVGPGTLRTYEWELELLKRLNITKEFPVFITETGWKRVDGVQELDFGKLYAEALKTVWKDRKIVSVTPFLLSYKDDPFLDFSWLSKDGQPYRFYYDVRGISKISGDPVQVTEGEITGTVYLPFVQAKHAVYGMIMVKNIGQSIWEAGKYDLKGGELLSLVTIEPNENKILFFKSLAEQSSGLMVRKLQLARKGLLFGNSSEIYARVINVPFILRTLFPIIPS